MAGSKETPYSKLRRHTRVQADIPVGVTSDRYRVHSALEVSEGGLLFTSSKAYAVGTPLELSLMLPNEKILTVNGEVAYVFRQRETYHVGVRFFGPSEEVQAMLRIYIQKEKRR